MRTDKEKDPKRILAVLSRGLTRYGRISARQNRVCPCQPMVRSKTGKTVQPVWTAPQKYDLFKLYSARKAKIYSALLLPPFAVVCWRAFFRRTPWMIKRARPAARQRHTCRRSHMYQRRPCVLTWSHSESVKRLVSSERLMNARPFESVSSSRIRDLARGSLGVHILLCLGYRR